MKLADMRPGECAKVTRIDDPTVRAQAIRFGISEGSEIICDEVIPAGPVIIRRGLMQYAVGRNLAQHIEVVPQIKPGQRRQRRGRVHA